jgi:phage shock protein PspC (stress-responsive transcriptional regulator)
MVVIRLLLALVFLVATVSLCVSGQWGVAGLAFLIMALCVPKARRSAHGGSYAQ